MGPKTVDCIFIWYFMNIITYRFLVLKTVVNLFDANNIIESKDTKFFEEIFLMKIIIGRSLPREEKCDI